MKKLFGILALGILAATSPLKASTGQNFLEEKYKAALNEMVQKVRNTPDPSEKREILQHFIIHMRDGLDKAKGMESISQEDRNVLHVISGKYYAYNNELNGQAGFNRVPDSDLNEFAGFMRQGMEQAPMNGGVYISGGALLVIIILLVLFL
jgi:hypothetical protein